MPTPSDALLVQVTIPAAQAEALARHLVGQRLAACVQQIAGVRSVYRWQGEVCVDAETLLLIKTAADRFEALRAEVLARHPYELPEIIAVPLANAHPAYLQWLLQESSPPSLG